MTSHTQKTVLIGVTGCIAAYKSCEIVRCLQKEGIRVKVVMTEHATHFIDPLTFRALTHEPVAIGLFDDPSDPIHHISLAQEADLFLIAPCTANVMAKVTYGLADDLLTTTALATTAPVVIAPAMNVHMYENAATQHNMDILRGRGISFVEADSGYLACGEEGKGRLADPSVIAKEVVKILDAEDAQLEFKQDLKGTRIMITAGPTVEPIDPVRYLSNRSSGKFGYAIAKAAAERGADVTLISGPVALPQPEGVKMVYVETANEMLLAADKAFSACDIGIFAAAVADVRPASEANKKLKKGINDSELANIALTENPDILSTLAHAKVDQIVVGFAAETNDVIENARKKLRNKAADMIVANEVGPDKAFGKDENEIWFVTNEDVEHVDPMEKEVLAHRVLDKTLELFF